MAQSDLDQLDNKLAAVLADAMGNGNVERGLVQGLTLCADTAERHCAGREMACTRGCPHCCVLNVSVLLPEAMRTAETTGAPLQLGALDGRRGTGDARRVLSAARHQWQLFDSSGAPPGMPGGSLTGQQLLPKRIRPDH